MSLLRFLERKPKTFRVRSKERAVAALKKIFIDAEKSENAVVKFVIGKDIDLLEDILRQLNECPCDVKLCFVCNSSAVDKIKRVFPNEDKCEIIVNDSYKGRGFVVGPSGFYYQEGNFFDEAYISYEQNYAREFLENRFLELKNAA